MAVKELPLFSWDQQKMEEYFRGISTTRRQLFYLQYIEKHIAAAYASNPQLDEDGIHRDYDHLLDDVFPEVLQFCKRERLLLEEAIAIDWTTDSEPVLPGSDSPAPRHTPSPIAWKGTINDLTYLMDQLVVLGFIPEPERKTEFITEHFMLLKRKGKEAGTELVPIKTRTVTNTRAQQAEGARSPTPPMKDVIDEMAKRPDR